MMADSKVVLYSYWRSSCSWRVRIALNLKGVAFEYRAVNLVRGEQRSDAFRQDNPSCAVPLLLIDGHSIAQSLAIIEYLEATRPHGVALLPRDPFRCAQVRTISYMIAADIQPVQNLKVLQRVGDDRKMEWGHDVISAGLAAVEALVVRTAGKFCVGDDVSMADLCLIPQLYNARRFQVALEAMPTLLRIEAACMELDAFKSADPAVQPDAVA